MGADPGRAMGTGIRSEGEGTGAEGSCGILPENEGTHRPGSGDRDPHGAGRERIDGVTDSVRVDAWLWAVRVYKTRSAATAACRAGHVRVGGDRAKAAQPVRIGDELRVRIAGFDRRLVVKQLLLHCCHPPAAPLPV